MLKPVWKCRELLLRAKRVKTYAIHSAMRIPVAREEALGASVAVLQIDSRGVFPACRPHKAPAITATLAAGGTSPRSEEGSPGELLISRFPERSRASRAPGAPKRASTADRPDAENSIEVRVNQGGDSAGSRPPEAAVGPDRPPLVAAWTPLRASRSSRCFRTSRDSPRRSSFHRGAAIGRPAALGPRDREVRFRADSSRIERLREVWTARHCSPADRLDLPRRSIAEAASTPAALGELDEFLTDPVVYIERPFACQTVG
jgi:hypothetical protein